MTEMVADGQVVAMDYTLTVDGEIVDTSKGNEPMEYLHGAGNIIIGLERELTGMKIGESKSVVVAPKDGYGELNPDAFMEVQRSEIPADILIEVGAEIEVSDEDGHPMHAQVDEINDKTVLLNFNHPLAGMELHFDIKIVGLRKPTAEERDHGHAHTHGHGH
jgi:FKBP-type peptidyl-prolyl cis-trans isomerase SlyD